MGNWFSGDELSQFQKKKLLHEFYTFFDLNKDGELQWKDFDMARSKVCELSGWKLGSEKYIHTHDCFVHLWRQLQDDCDTNYDGLVTAGEWLRMWETYLTSLKKKKKKKDEDPDHTDIPNWLERYIEYKFHLYDRTGDGHIDVEEFEYVLSDFGVSPRDARACFLIFSENGERKVDMEYFRELTAEYFKSNDPCALGSFVTGRLDFDD